MSPHPNRLARYLKARRAQVEPEQVGFPADPGRRLRGLKRTEVAELAGISPEYYTRLEQGLGHRPSEQVLAGLTRALKLDADAAAYFYRLALPEPSVYRQPAAPTVTEPVLQIIEQWSDVPVYVYDRNQDVIMANDLALALFPKIVPGSNAVQIAFSMALELRETPQWKALARTVVAALRFHGDPADPRLQEIVGELSVHEPIFRTIWADYEAVPLTSGTVPAYVEGFGVVDFPWQNLRSSGGLFIGVWPAPPGTIAFTVLEHLRVKLRAPIDGPQRTFDEDNLASTGSVHNGGLSLQHRESIRLVTNPDQSVDPAL
ncbi:transcriptional regulator with XRE-family HTH domain [Conyzicola nivalis]|uniref:Transcriptional regulator with XRE-family HTH domain n=1 Tax=Conyzicola nivalis TaxID=1477021 RepID=A0ABV2QST0_9MICO